MEVFYHNYIALTQLSWGEKQRSLDQAALVWCTANLDVKKSTTTRPLVTRPGRSMPLMDPPVRHRLQRGESKLWQRWLPACDFDTWAQDARWMVNPNSGHAFANVSRIARASLVASIAQIEASGRPRGSMAPA